MRRHAPAFAGTIWDMEPLAVNVDDANALRRTVVVGTTGSGKTTFAAGLARILGVPHVELDALYWDPGWTPAPTHEFRARAAEAVTPYSWVVDGNYGAIRDIVWSRATALVWLDMPLALILLRLLRRGLARSLTRRELWNGNRERIWGLVGPDSLLLWALKTHGRRRREYTKLPYEPGYEHLKVFRLRSPQGAGLWLAAVAEAVGRCNPETPGRD